MSKQVLGLLKDNKTKAEIGRIIQQNGDWVLIEYGQGDDVATFEATLNVIRKKFECHVEWL